MPTTKIRGQQINIVADLSLAGYKIINLATPLADDSPNTAATKGYVDNAIQGLDIKQSVKAATTETGGNITLSGLQTIDGISLVENDRVLVKNQTNAVQNGIYIVKTGAWERASDLPASSSAAGVFCFVERGSINGDHGFVCTNDDGSDIVGTNELIFVQFSGAGQIDAGDGLTKTGNQLNVGEGNGIQVNSDSIEVKLDGSTLTKSSSGLKVSNGGITELQLNGSVAGAGLTGGNGLALAVGEGNGIQVNADDISLKLKTTSGLEVDSSGLAINDNIAGNGLSISNKVLSVNVGNGLQIVSDSVRIDTDVVVDLSSSQTLTNKTLTLPTITDFTNATHNHENAIGGGQLSITNATTGTLPTTRGGTGLTSYTAGDIIYASGTNTLAKLAIGNNGQVLTIDNGIPKWMDPSGDITEVIAGNGLSGGGTEGSITLDVNAGNGIEIVSDNVQVKASSGIAVDSNGVKVNFARENFTADNDDDEFILASTPVSGSELVFLNGLLQTPVEDYSLVGTTLEFVTGLQKENDKVSVWYLK